MQFTYAHSISRLFACLVALSALGCGPAAQDPSSQASLPDTATVLPEMVPPETTAIPEETLEDFPEGFALAQLTLHDSATDHTSTLDFPRSETDTLLNAVIRKYCVDFAERQVPSQRVEDFASSSFSMWVVAMQVHPQLLSIQFLEQSYYSGSAHFNHGNPCLNLDLMTRKTVPFTQLFTFSRGHTKAQFCEMTNAINPHAPGAIAPELLDAKLDYFLGADSLVLCFDDYDLGPSMCQLRVPMDSLGVYLTARGKKYLGR